MKKSTTTWFRLTLLWCTTCNLMITLQLLGDLDHLGRVHVRHREDHVEDQGDPHRRHRCQCSCRRDWGVQFVFFHIKLYMISQWFYQWHDRQDLCHFLAIYSYSECLLNNFYFFKTPGACVERHCGQSHLDGSRWKSHSSFNWSSEWSPWSSSLPWPPWSR